MLRHLFTEDWFVRTDTTGTEVGPLVVPYDAMLRERRDSSIPSGMNTGFYPGGRYLYHKTFRLAEGDRAHAHVLEFEGVFHRSLVLVNGHLAGGRPSGYATFHVPLDDYLLPEDENLIEVVVDTSDQPNSRWYSGSGIHRPVHMLTGGLVRITPFGPRLTTLDVQQGTATVAVEVDVINDTESIQPITVWVTLTDPDGVETTSQTMATVGPATTTTVELTHLVSDAQQWSPEDPVLYAVNARLEHSGAVLDEAVEAFGIRTIEVDPHHGLRINGLPVLLRGACIHHDNGVIGATELDAAADRRVRILQEAGYNAIRSAHNPMSKALLRACDRRGMLVLDELCDAWYHPKQTHDYGVDFEEWWSRDLESMVRRGHNHPSIIMWSIGNEISETSQPRGVELNRFLADRCRSLDPSRPVTNGINPFLNLIAPNDAKKTSAVANAKEGGEDVSKNLIVVLNFAMSMLSRVMPWILRRKKVDERTRGAFAALDVAGYNYGNGRYRLDGRIHPDRVIVGTETAAPNIVQNWKLVQELPYVIGEFQWTGWDYIGEAGIAAIRYDERNSLSLPYPALLAGEPVIDITGELQTQTHLNQITFGLKRGPVIAVQPVNHAGRRQTTTGWRASNSIASWSWEGFEGTDATVEVYAAAHRVELRLNDRTVGSKPVREGFKVEFTVPYEPGTLSAIAYDTNGAVIGRDRLTSAGATLHLTVRSDASTLIADGMDLAWVSISLTDDSGIVRPLADREIQVVASGAGELAGAGSANPISTDEFTTGRFTTYNGRGQAVLRSAPHEGTLTLTISAEGLEPVELVIPVVGKAHPDEFGRPPLWRVS